MVLVLGPAPTSSSVTRVFQSIDLICERTGALPFGKEALKRLGGQEKTLEKKKESSLFPEEKIVIPAGVTPQNLKNYTLYDMLGLGGELGASADTEVIRKAYHKAVLMYHPDKAQYKTSTGKEDRSVFLKIQEAFNVLSNESKRRAYDSQLPFDESVPTEAKLQEKMAKNPNRFFKLFDPVFKRNARFAAKKPVPELGDMETPLPEVYKFYEYWINFDSWRDFTGVNAEYKPDDATCREEKRYMIKENERLAKKYKKREMERIVNMVMLAEKYDPRVVGDKERKRAAKEADKEAREAESRKRSEEEAAAKAWDEAMEKEALEKKSLSKAEKEKLKKAESKARNILRKLLRASAAKGHGSGEYGILTDSDVELLCAHCELDELNTINTAMGGEPASKDAELFQISGAEDVLIVLEKMKERATHTVDDERMAKEAKRREQEEASRSGSSTQKKKTNSSGIVPDRDWSEADYQVCLKALERYPAGQANRWVVITNYVNDKIQAPDVISQDEVLRASYRAATGNH